MSTLILGLIVFFAAHSVRIVADDWRARQIAGRGEMAWKGAYTVVSLVGFVLIVWGYGLARVDPTVLWVPPVWLRHVAVLLTILAFILLAATYVPGTYMKAAIGHPMLAGVKVWAFAHLLANNTIADVVLFGTFLIWAVFGFRSARQRDRVTNTTYTAVSVMRDVLAVFAGLIGWAVFTFLLHTRLIGVSPM